MPYAYFNKTIKNSSLSFKIVMAAVLIAAYLKMKELHSKGICLRTAMKRLFSQKSLPAPPIAQENPQIPGVGPMPIEEKQRLMQLNQQFSPPPMPDQVPFVDGSVLTEHQILAEKEMKRQGKQQTMGTRTRRPTAISSQIKPRGAPRRIEEDESTPMDDSKFSPGFLESANSPSSFGSQV